MRLDRHSLEKSQREEGKAPAPVTRQSDADTFGFPPCRSHEVLPQVMDPTQGTHKSEASPLPRLDKEDITGEGNPYLEEPETKALQNVVRNLPETTIMNDQCLTNETLKQFMKYKDKIQHESLHENNYSAELDGTGNITHIPSIEISSAPNFFTDNVQDDNKLDVYEDYSALSSSKTNVVYPPRRPSSTRHLAVAEPSASLSAGSDLSWKKHPDKYYPVRVDLAGARQVHPLFSSFQLNKGVMFSIFFWVYLVTFVYAMCCILSSIVTPSSILGGIVKVLLVYYFPTIIQLEVFRAVEFIMTLIYNTFT